MHVKMEEEKENLNGEITTDSNSYPEDKEREKWDKKIEYILSILGYIVGLGNFWRFPYLCMRNGGGAFLFPFIMCCFFIAFPLFFLEVSLGQFTAKGVAHCWEACPLFKGVGIGMVIINAMCSLYYIMVVTWTLFYLGNSFMSPLPWTTCGNVWNTEDCYIDSMISSPYYNNDTYLMSNQTMMIANISVEGLSNHTHLNKTEILARNLSDRVSSQEEFWQYRVLDMTSGIEEFGRLNMNILLCLLASWVVIFLCMMKGIKSVGKVVYITATLPYILLIILLIRGVTLPGALNGIRYYIYPNFSRITDPKVWIEAAIQVFYSTCVCWGPLITMASYNKFNNNSLRDTALLITAGEGFSVFGGFVVFSVLGFMAHINGVDIEDVVKSGPGLIYVAYPEVVSKLPLPNLWAVIFFIMVLTLGLDSQFAGCEPIISVFTDSYRFFRQKRLIFTAVVMAVFFLLGFPLCFQGGIYLFQLMDWYIAAFCIPVYGIIECLVFGWIYGAEMFSRDVQLMMGRPVPVIIRIMWCFITPTLLLTLLITIIVRYEPPTYGKYNYPVTANVFGLIYAIVPLIPVVVCAILVLRKSKGRTFQEKIKNSLKPTKLWYPGDRAASKIYTEEDRSYPYTWSERFRMTLIGR